MIVYEYVLRERVIPKSPNYKSAYNQIVSMKLNCVEYLLDKPKDNSITAAQIKLLEDMMDLRRVVHSLGAIVFAFFGGLLGRLFYSRRFISIE
jgi:hypothetical protein